MLKKQSKNFILTAFVIWQLLTYYAYLFKLDVPSDVTKLRIKLFVDDANVTHLKVKLPNVQNPDSYYTESDMKTIMNEYLNIVLLPEQAELSPFSGGSSIYDTVDRLYVNQIQRLRSGHTYIDVIYVDNMQAYQYVKSQNSYLKGEV